MQHDVRLRCNYALMKKLFPDGKIMWDEETVDRMMEKLGNKMWWYGFWAGFAVCFGTMLAAELIPNLWR